jgi:D-3-phosphoglycerate dehydrogenase
MTAISERPLCVVTWPGFDPADDTTAGQLRRAGLEIRVAPNPGARSSEEVERLMIDATAAIVSTDPFDRDLLGRLPKLRVIARTGTGVDSIDVEAATEAGVAIATASEAHIQTVADHTVAMLLALIRRVIEHDASVRNGEWSRGGDLTPDELFGKTVGIVGYGRIGRAVAQRLQAFDCHLLICDPAAEPPVEGELVHLGELLRQSDVVSLHVPLTPLTRGLIGERELAVLRPEAILLNTARGGVIDEDALAARLRKGLLAGAALDVFEEEPPLPALFEGLTNVLLSPHIAGLSTASIRRLTAEAVAAVLAVLGGEPCAAVINPLALEHPRHRPTHPVTASRPANVALVQPGEVPEQ